ncbi:unnamed protein product [Oikopleura dioica]|uniref:Uncharacterized protein n=1 Tax=Oikopleura dioica TaxID=34765 RepID=E4YEK9_OIKDI|nr:unnamed protein product [Oikopleura dioica]
MAPGLVVLKDGNIVVWSGSKVVKIDLNTKAISTSKDFEGLVNDVIELDEKFLVSHDKTVSIVEKLSLEFITSFDVPRRPSKLCMVERKCYIADKSGDVYLVEIPDAEKLSIVTRDVNFSNFFRGGAEHGGRKISALRRSGAEKFLLVAEIRLDCNPLWRKSAMAEKNSLWRKSAMAEKSLRRKKIRCGGNPPWRKNRCGGKKFAVAEIRRCGKIALAEKKPLWGKTAVAEKNRCGG